MSIPTLLVHFVPPRLLEALHLLLDCFLSKFMILTVYRVFDNERNEALVYHFEDAYDVGHVAKVSFICDNSIFGF